jgi:hypothetical protein
METKDLRDKHNTPEGYKGSLEWDLNKIVEFKNRIAELEESEKKGVQVHSIPNSQVIENTRKSISDKLAEVFLTKYSMGLPVSDLRADFDAFAEAFHNVKEPRYYTRIVNMLSAGILLDADNLSFGKIVEPVKRDYPKERAKDLKFCKDWLIDLLINYKMPEIERVNRDFWWKKPYAIFEDLENAARTDKAEAVKILKKYLQKQWLPTNNTQSRGKSYHSGYWSFESGAVVKIFGLDDTSLKDLAFYPYDMVHWRD